LVVMLPALVDAGEEESVVRFGAVDPVSDLLHDVDGHIVFVGGDVFIKIAGVLNAFNRLLPDSGEDMQFVAARAGAGVVGIRGIIFKPELGF